MGFYRLFYFYGEGGVVGAVPHLRWGHSNLWFPYLAVHRQQTLRLLLLILDQNIDLLIRHRHRELDLHLDIFRKQILVGLHQSE